MRDFSTVLLINILKATVDHAQESPEIDQASPGFREFKRTLLERIVKLQGVIREPAIQSDEVQRDAMDFRDKTLKCVICAEEFVFSAGEQMFFSEKQFQHEPKHCKKCKARRENVRQRHESSVICAECGNATIVPFLASEGRPVLCRPCFDRTARGASIPRGGLSSDPSQ